MVPSHLSEETMTLEEAKAMIASADAAVAEAEANGVEITDEFLLQHGWAYDANSWTDNGTPEGGHILHLPIPVDVLKQLVADKRKNEQEQSASTTEEKQRLTDAYNKFMADPSEENWNGLEIERRRKDRELRREEK
jgi:hypothetical protein